MLKIEIETENAAFEGDNKVPECSRILREVTNRLALGRDSGRILDINGNTVGRFELTGG